MTDERFDLITALYAVCCDYHSGQWSRGYRLMSRITTAYRPRNLPDRRELVLDKWEGRNEWSGAYEKYRELRTKYRGKL